MQQKGMSLIEVMVAVFILGSGLLGLGALQARALQFNDSAHKRSIAADLATDLAERIRANRSPFMASSDAEPRPPLPPDFSFCKADPGAEAVACEAQPTTDTKYRETYRVANEMSEWYTTLRNQLPGSSYALLAVEGLNYPFQLTYTLTITWRDHRGEIAAEDPANFSYVAVFE